MSTFLGLAMSCTDSSVHLRSTEGPNTSHIPTLKVQGILQSLGWACSFVHLTTLRPNPDVEASADMARKSVQCTYLRIQSGSAFSRAARLPLPLPFRVMAWARLRLEIAGSLPAEGRVGLRKLLSFLHRL